MFDIIVQAAENFFQHQIRLPFEVAEGGAEMRTLIASIDIDAARERSHRIYVACDDAMVAMITETFLGEPAEDEETMTDMVLETANLIVGSAKVLAEELGPVAFSIRTPNYVKYDRFDLECDQLKTVSVDGRQMILGIKEQ